MITRLKKIMMMLTIMTTRMETEMVFCFIVVIMVVIVLFKAMNLAFTSNIFRTHPTATASMKEFYSFSVLVVYSFILVIVVVIVLVTAMNQKPRFNLVAAAV